MVDHCWAPAEPWGMDSRGSRVQSPQVESNPDVSFQEGLGGRGLSSLERIYMACEQPLLPLSYAV